ncbi:zinc-dependent alcohol dehydrogenase family protein [Polaromonas naphthalenivorans]|uniref:zinc-dependent alcohol dehydrogenase family protein n=1 Tax=Polaromonas naphthalenivorans TaxID=216465 RepID=UPI0038CD667E
MPTSMFAMSTDPLGRELLGGFKPVPQPGDHDVVLRVLACGVCRTDLHIIDGELPPRLASVVPGHEVVGQIVARGALASRFAVGQRVGIPWLGGTCGACAFCAMQRENLCDFPVFTGYDRDGGFAEYAAADERFCFALPFRYDDCHAAPLLCAGLIGFRAWRLAGESAPRRLGLYGFGAAAHIICQIAVSQKQEVYAFTQPGDAAGQQFARSLGAAWAGGSDQAPPLLLDAALIFAPVGALVPAALAATRKGGTVVCAGIHMSPIPTFEYRLLWGERVLKSVANLTREDGDAFFSLLEDCRVQTHVQAFALQDANAAVQALRDGTLNGAAVLVP